ncbi:pyrroline-5-carboxylate reductase [Gayadomonas joobiniege]|uniref:pyrroline-5-carboxylate reductase n=1 Tax=Gayadomonas joobiniege TaxID=1234606 RepID=UPI00035F9E37|nr:pyrroline-5-carboxylate reductase [Gayadomonas joobiniege]
MQLRKIAFIGAGNMSRSIISGLVQSGYPADHLIASNRSNDKLTALENDFRISTTQNNDKAIAWADVVVLAVKPQMMAEMIASLTSNPEILQKKLYISIAAGIPIERFNQMFGFTVNLVRTMPNTPSLLGLGLTGLYAPENVSADDKSFANDLMKAVGKTVTLADEDGIDAIIGVAGSAPAYFFLFMECLAEQAEKQGFSAQQAREIVAQVALGAATMVNNSDIPIATLRQQVTSKGGTTAKALDSFNQDKLSDVTERAVQAAINRAKEMANLF